ncbi:MAG: cell division protein SepF [Thermoplasmatota archaeon]
MGLKSLFAAKPAPTTTSKASGDDFIDLDEHLEDTELFDQTASMMVKVGELTKYDELRDFVNYVYKGNLVLLDFSAIESDEIVVRRIISDLKKLVADINGDIAGLGQTMMIIAPTGVRIDRNKARSGY